MTTSLNRRRSKLVQQAGQVLQEKGLFDLPVDLDALAAASRIHLQAMDVNEEGVSGMLLRVGNSFGIRYATHIRNEGFQRFSIAHEFGHYFIEGHLDHIQFDAGVHSSRAGFISSDQFEREAEYFAAGLLMPTGFIRSLINRSVEGLTAVSELRRRAKASFTAAAIRYVTLTDAAVAVVVSRDGVVDYCFKSDLLKSLKGTTWLKKGSAMPTGSVSHDLAISPQRSWGDDPEQADTDILEWFGGSRSVAAREEAIRLGSYGRILTLITCPELIDDTYRDEEEDEDTDAVLENRWTVSFRN